MEVVEKVHARLKATQLRQWSASTYVLGYSVDLPEHAAEVPDLFRKGVL
jgi:hypothetical protein